MRIPAINLGVKVAGVSLGVNAEPPFDPNTIDWLVYQDTSRGANPGTSATNATYIAGHTWHGADGHGAFNVIDTKLRKGQDVYVLTRASRRLGVWLHYRVTWMHLYPKGSLHKKTNVLWRIKPRLVLITCHLRKDGGAQTDNRVFFARLIGLNPLK